MIFSFKIRIGDQNHNSTADDDEVIVLDVISSHKHPSFDCNTSYFDVAVLSTKTVNFGKVSWSNFQNVLWVVTTLLWSNLFLEASITFSSLEQCNINLSYYALWALAECCCCTKGLYSVILICQEDIASKLKLYS